MGLFSKSTTVQQTAVTNLTDASNIGVQLSDDASSIVLRGDNSSVEIIDAGAVNSAFGFAERTASAYAENTRDIVRGNTDLSSRVVDASADLASRFLNDSSNLSRQFSELTRDVSESASKRVADLASENASDLRSFAQFQSQSESGRLAELVKIAIGAVAVIFVARVFFAGRKVSA